MNTKYPAPVGYEPPARFSFNANTDWQRVCARGLHFEPYSGDTSSATVRGDCLHPLLIEGQDALTIRPYVEGEPLVDGDLYVIAWDDTDDEGVKQYIDARSGKAFIAKFVRYICGEWYVQWNEAIAPLKGEVIAKVVGVTHTAPSIVLGQLANNAVTESYDAVEAFGPTATAGTTSSSTGSFTLPALAADATLKIRVEYEAHNSATGGSSDNAYYSVGGVQTALTNQIRQNYLTKAGDLSASQVTNVSSISFTAGQVVTFGVTATANAGSGTNAITNIRYAILVLKK